MNVGDVILLLTWFGSGFLIMFGVWIFDMRGKEFDKNYFCIENILLSLIILLFGHISLIIACYVYCDNKKPFTKLMYKIANIGIKNQKKTSK